MPCRRAQPSSTASGTTPIRLPLPVSEGSKRRAIVSLLAGAFLLATATSGDARTHHGGHGHHGFSHHGFHSHALIVAGPAFWWGPPYPYWWYYPAPPYYSYPPPVIVQEPPVYVQPPPAPPESYWYYCPSAQAYYPNVRSCPEVWIKVPRRP
jgi:hypothetical protein